jgi:hypothetical protein
MTRARRTLRPGTQQIAAVVSVILLAACGGAGRALPLQRHPSPIVRPAAGPPAHLAVIVMENEECAGIISSPSALTPNLCHDMHDCPVSTGDRLCAG